MNPLTTRSKKALNVAPEASENSWKMSLSTSVSYISHQYHLKYLKYLQSELNDH